MSMCGRRLGMTLVELLMVIAVIGALFALLLPAVQAAREAARRAECANHLRQLTLASLAHEQAHGFFPSGGWGNAWIGDADCGFGRTQPGGWAFSVLPFLEQSPVHELGKGGNAAFKKAAAIHLAQTVLGTFYCPSRRGAALYPHDPASTPPLNPGIEDMRVAQEDLPVVARMCYAMNGGTVCLGHPSLPYTMSAAANFTGWADTSVCNGIAHQRSETRVSEISDGASNTYLIGEKNVNVDCYTSYSAPGDSQSMFNGWDEDNVRYGGADSRRQPPREYPLIPDTSGIDAPQCFGGPHPRACLFAFCDGSVRPIGYSIKMVVHHGLAARDDGAVSLGEWAE